MKKSVVNMNTSSFSHFPTVFSAEHVIYLKQFNRLSQVCWYYLGYTCVNFLKNKAGFWVNFINVYTGTSKVLGSIVFKTYV